MTLQCALMIAITLCVSTPARGQYPAKSATTNWNAFMIVDGESTHDGRVIFCESPDATFLDGKGCAILRGVTSKHSPKIVATLDAYLERRLSGRLLPNQRAVAIGVAPILTGRGFNSGPVGASASTTQFTLYYRVESQ